MKRAIISSVILLLLCLAGTAWGGEVPCGIRFGLAHPYGANTDEERAQWCAENPPEKEKPCRWEVRYIDPKEEIPMGWEPFAYKPYRPQITSGVWTFMAREEQLIIRREVCE